MKARKAPLEIMTEKTFKFQFEEVFTVDMFGWATVASALCETTRDLALRASLGSQLDTWLGIRFYLITSARSEQRPKQ